MPQKIFFKKNSNRECKHLSVSSDRIVECDGEATLIHAHLPLLMWLNHNQSRAPASRFALTHHRVIDAKAKNRRVTRCREFFKNDSLSGDATKICREFPTFIK